MDPAVIAPENISYPSCIEMRGACVTDQKFSPYAKSVPSHSYAHGFVLWPCTTTMFVKVMNSCIAMLQAVTALQYVRGYLKE
jgi:hypothetical protein